MCSPMKSSRYFVAVRFSDKGNPNSERRAKHLCERIRRTSPHHLRSVRAFHPTWEERLFGDDRICLTIAEGNLILKQNVIRLASLAKINKKAAHHPDWR